MKKKILPFYYLQSRLLSLLIHIFIFLQILLYVIHLSYNCIILVVFHCVLSFVCFLKASPRSCILVKNVSSFLEIFSRSL